ncbi:MAG: HigA family addiction module antidote protein [Firmicutes bacterium]|nr:HigA family addiction module antidote protein [Bacillota bacterium]MBQ1826084.1 HigA family addiction module antidote protein [Bacillota bacterium]
MSNYFEFNDKVAFHPGYYIKEIVDESGLTQEDFAKRLGTTPKNLSILIRGEQSLSIEMASKLSRMLGTSVGYWLGLQQAYNEMYAEFLMAEDLKHEKEIFKLIDYKYFRDHFGLPSLPRKTEEQISCIRDFLSVASLTVLGERNLAVSFRSYKEDLSLSNIVNANALTQIAVNQALKTEAPSYDKKKFMGAVSFALTQTQNHETFLPVIKDAFLKAGVVLVVLPNLKNSGINGATKKVDGKMMLMVNDRRHYADTFWFSLFHEIGHILDGDLGMSFSNDAEDRADLYAQSALIPQEQYCDFILHHKHFNKDIIVEFAKSIDRDPGIVLGRLMKDKLVEHSEAELSNKLRHKYNIVIS